MTDLTYVTITSVEDYHRLTGVDLNQELTARIADDIGEGGNTGARFIYQVENYLKEKIFNHNPIQYKPQMLEDGYQFETEHQTKQFKRAVCYQISYLLKNGNVTNNISDLLSREQMEVLGLDSNAERCLYIGGLWNIARC